MKIKGFKAWRPNKKFVKDVASVPYDVVDYDQALELSKGNPLSFLHVVRADIHFSREDNPYSDKIYQKAKSNLQKLIDEKVLLQESSESIYLYSQKLDDHVKVLTNKAREYRRQNKSMDFVLTDFEKKLAEKIYTNVEKRNPEKTK